MGSGGNNSFIGANSIVFIVNYVSTDGTQSEFKRIGNPHITNMFSSATFSVMQETKPVFSLGKTSGQRYAIGPVIIRGKLVFTVLSNNGIFEMTDFYLKSTYKPDGTKRDDLYDEESSEIYKNQNEILANNGTINGTTMNPFDLWVYNHGEDGKTYVTTLFGVKIDVFTVVKDVNNQDIKIAEFNAINYNETIPSVQAERIMWSSNYDDYIKGIINSMNQKGKLPFRRR